MPLYNFYCKMCDKEIKRILSPEDVEKEVLCKSDGSVLERLPTQPITTIMEEIDTGMMPRKVTQIAGAPELIKEREFNDRKHRYKKTLV